MFFKKKSAAGPPAATRRRFTKPVLIALAVIVVAGSVVGLKATGQKEEKKANKKVVLEFTPADLATVQERQLVNSIQFSGSLAPVTQTTVKARVSGDLMRVL